MKFIHSNLFVFILTIIFLSQINIGNVFCANRHRVPGVTLLFDVLSFPYMMRVEGVGVPTGSDEKKYSIPANTHALKEQHTSQSKQDTHTLDIKKDPSLQRMIVSSYINIKKYCKPWPSCVFGQ